MTKQQLRKHYKALRAALKDKDKKSAAICQWLENSDSFREARTVALYAALPDEVDMTALLESAHVAGKHICLPKVQGSTMHFFTVNTDTPLAEGAFGIPEPQGTSPVSPEEIDLLVVPLLAADTAHKRLGMGGGYYDRYLADFRGITIGACFRVQIADGLLPREEHDIPLDYICTETGWL